MGRYHANTKNTGAKISYHSSSMRVSNNNLPLIINDQILLLHPTLGDSPINIAYSPIILWEIIFFNVSFIQKNTSLFKSDVYKKSFFIVVVSFFYFDG